MASLPATESFLTEVELNGDEERALAPVLEDLAQEFRYAEHPEFLRMAPGMGTMLPEQVLRPLLDMRYRESYAGIVVRRPLVVEPSLPTPDTWRGRPPGSTVEQDFWLVLILSQLGDPMAWSYLQGGRLLNDIVPEMGAEETQTGQGSTAELDFHVEEADHDLRAQAFGLMCLRNRRRTPTTLASASCLRIPEEMVKVLFEPRFRIGDDDDHIVRPVLFGHPGSPYLRVDPPYTSAVPGDEEAKKALAVLVETLRKNQTDVFLTPGDVLAVDNYRAVHGRRPFQARYDGTDRWLRRVSVIRDLRRLRHMRDGVDGRVVVPEET